MRADVLGRAQEIAAELMDAAAERQATPFMNLVVEPGVDAIRIVGYVLSPKQQKLVSRRFSSLDVEVQLEVLAETSLEDTWVAAADESPVDVREAPTPVARLSFQIESGDPTPRVVRLPTEVPGYLLCKAADGSLGWVCVQDVRLVPKPESGVMRAQAVRAETMRISSPTETILTEACRHLGTPYLMGGKSANGVDCSGLVQRVYLRSIGLLLPKHTADQMRTGIRVAPGQAREADVVFLERLSGQKHLHEALLMNTSGALVMHASRDQLKVIEEPLDSLLEAYAMIGWRRYVELKG